jgi:hypothetical protein
MQMRVRHKESETSTLSDARRGDDEWDQVEDMKMGFGLCDNLERSAILMHEYPLTLRFCISHPEFKTYIWIQQFLCKQKELYSKAPLGIAVTFLKSVYLFSIWQLVLFESIF